MQRNAEEWRQTEAVYEAAEIRIVASDNKLFSRRPIFPRTKSPRRGSTFQDSDSYPSLLGTENRELSLESVNEGCSGLVLWANYSPDMMEFRRFTISNIIGRRSTEENI
jgi:hypothetical protein